MRRVLLALTVGLTLTISAEPRVLQAQAPAAATSVAARSKELSALLAEIWEDTLKHSPETASYLGDKRYDDQLTDYSAAAVNAALARGMGFIQRLSAIDTTGLTHQEQLSAELMLRSLIEDQEGARFKEWEMPVNQFDGFHTDLPQLGEPAELRRSEGLRQLHCAAEEGSDGVLADDAPTWSWARSRDGCRRHT